MVGQLVTGTSEQIFGTDTLKHLASALASMQAARYYGEDDLRLESVPKPTIGPGEVLVNLQAASICGSDINYLTGKTDPATEPVTLGHEGAGIVEAVGPGVETVTQDDRVVIHYVQSCGGCRPCNEGNDNRCRHRNSIGHHVDGTFAEYIAVPERAVLPLPDEVSFGEGSITGCAVSTGYHAVHVADVRPGDCVVVFGAGGVGLHAILWASRLGAGTTVAVDLDDRQLEAAAEYGADVLVNPDTDDVTDRVLEVTDGWGANASIECSGSPQAMAQAIDVLTGQTHYESGTAVSVGIQTEPMSVEYTDIREGQLRVSGDHNRAELGEILRLLSRGAVDVSPTITHEVPLEDIHAGVETVMARDEQVGRVIVDLTG